MQTVVNGALVNYVETGKGKTLLCVHGWMHDHTSFSQLAQELKDEYRVIALDLPNFGGSEVTDKVESIADYAAFLAAFVEKLQIKDYVLVGHSMGCQIGMYAVGNNILTPKKIILISPAGVRNNRRLYKKTLKLTAVVLRRFVPKSYKKKFYKLIGSDYNPDLSWVHKQIIASTLTTDVQAEAAKISIPVVIINGTADSQTPLWMAEKLNAEIKGSTLDIIKGGDHYIHQNHTEVVAPILRTFLS